METWIAFLKGVNVGGRNKLPMNALAAEMEAAGMSDVKTYIQSGNLIFRLANEHHANLATKISTTINAKFGFAPPAIVIGSKRLVSAATANPFPKAENEAKGKTLHLFFLDKTPAAIDLNRLEKIRRSSERWKIIDDILYMHTPEGFGNSKLATQAEKILGVTATARNWKTVCALIELAESYAK